MEVVDITDTYAQTGLKGMKKVRAPGICEVGVKMVIRVEETGREMCKKQRSTSASHNLVL